MARLTLSEQLYNFAIRQDVGDICAATRKEFRALDSEISTLRARVASLEEALTASAETKYAYIGEFEFKCHCGNPINVPWTTIKEIMAMIRARAALKEQGGA